VEGIVTHTLVKGHNWQIPSQWSLDSFEPANTVHGEGCQSCVSSAHSKHNLISAAGCAESLWQRYYSPVNIT